MRLEQSSGKRFLTLDEWVEEMRNGNLWSSAVLVEEAETLSRLTRWLIVLSIILSALTVVLAYPIIRSLLG